MRRRWLVQASRGDLAWTLLGFALLQLALVVAIERWLPELRDPYYAYRAAGLRRRLSQAERPLTVVMLGSSRTQNGLQSSALEQSLRAGTGRRVVVYNFGIPGAGPVTQLLYLKRLRALGIRPDLLLVEVVPMLLDGHSPEPPELPNLVADRLWLHELAGMGRYHVPVGELCRDWWESEVVACSGHRFAILSRLLPELLPNSLRLDYARKLDASGWQEPMVRCPSAEQRRRSRDQAWREHGQVLQTFCLGQGASQALRDLLELCRGDGIATTLVWMPEGSEFRSWYAPTARRRILGFLDELGRAYAAPLVDARKWVADDGFRDGHHLLVGGAAVFTERLKREYLLPALRTLGPAGPPYRTGAPLSARAGSGTPPRRLPRQ